MRGLQLHSHPVLIERRRNGDFYAITTGAKVLPDEQIRATTKVSNFGRENIEFGVLDPRRNIVFSETVNANLARNAWVDFTAPNAPGTYTVVASAEEGSWNPFKGFKNRHEVETAFKVSPLAVNPGSEVGTPPDDPGIVGGFFSDLKGPAIFVVAILGLFLLVKVV